MMVLGLRMALKCMDADIWKIGAVGVKMGRITFVWSLSFLDVILPYFGDTILLEGNYSSSVCMEVHILLGWYVIFGVQCNKMYADFLVVHDRFCVRFSSWIVVQQRLRQEG
jgi:hypothetical protein